MIRNNYGVTFEPGDEIISEPYLVLANPSDWLTDEEKDEIREAGSIEAYDEVNDLECEMQEYFSSVKKAKEYIIEQFKKGLFVKAYIYNDIEERCISDVYYNEELFF